MDRSTAEMLASELIDELAARPDALSLARQLAVAADFLEGLAWAVELGDVEGWMEARLG